MVIDSTDKKLLSLLQEDASISTSALADKLHISQSPCWRRINRLEEHDEVFATVNLTQTGRQNLIEFEQMIKGHPEVLECYTMTGIWDYVLKIVTRDVRHYEDFVRNTLTASELIRELHSHIAVTEIKNTSALPLAAQVN